LLSEALKPVQTQAFRHVEIIVVDGGSRPPINLDRYGKIRIICHEKNRGAAAARNTGIQSARGDFVAFLPFLLLGLDSDNGGEFINDLRYRYCLTEKITFTRSRPYHKNDQAHVEQKNWSVVRRLIGYDRLEKEADYLLLQSIYADLRLYANFFQPVLKLVSKEHVDKKLLKRYGTAATPFQRVLAAKDISLETKARLTNLYVQLNPVQLKTTIDAKVAKLWKISR